MENIAVINITSFGREFPEHIEELEKKIGPVTKMQLSAETSGLELAEILADYQYVLLGNYPFFNEDFFRHNTSVKLIARHGIGINNIDVNAAHAYNVVVTNMPNSIEVDAVAEQALSLLSALAKNVLVARQMVASGEWNSHRERIMGVQLSHATTGIIGFGNIGKRFAEIMKYGFNNRILVYDPNISENDITSFGALKCSLNELLENSDFISLHASLNDDTYHLIDYQAISRIRSHTILVNTGRGDLVDEDAIFEAIQNRHLFGYGADVMHIEPAYANHPLLHSDHVIITPHSAIYNLTCMKAMNRKVMDDIYRVSEHKEPVNKL